MSDVQWFNVYQNPTDFEEMQIGIETDKDGNTRIESLSVFIKQTRGVNTEFEERDVWYMFVDEAVALRNALNKVLEVAGIE